MITREPEWDPTEVNWLLASRDYEASIGPHGHPLAETMSSEANPANAEGAWYYTAGPEPDVDWAMVASHKAEADYRELLPEGASMAGFQFPPRKVWRTRH